jgi:hypothetical protein
VKVLSSLCSASAVQKLSPMPRNLFQRQGDFKNTPWFENGGAD